MKKALALLLALLLLPLGGWTPARAEGLQISNTVPAVTGDAGTVIDLTDFTVELSDGTVLTRPRWTYEGQTVTEITFDVPGVYPLTAGQEGKSRTVYAVVKDPEDTEYVLYENEFDTEESIAGLDTVGNGLVSVQDGKLVIDTVNRDNTILLLPQWLGDFGDYSIEASAAMLSSVDANRWFSLCYRYTPESYLHMCVRKTMSKAGGRGASGGVECVNFSGGNWRYLYSTGYKRDMEYGTFYDFSLSAWGNMLQYRVNGDKVINIQDMADYYPGMPTLGRIGIQGNGSVIHFDRIRVTLQTQAPEMPLSSSPLIQVADNKTNLLNPVTNVASIPADRVTDILGATVLPASLLVEYGRDITAQDLDELYSRCARKNVIPGLWIHSQSDADTLAAWCDAQSFWDIQAASDQGPLLLSLRQQCPPVRTVLQFTDIEGLTAQQLRSQIRKYSANTLLIPAAQSTREAVAALQALHVTLWTQAAAPGKTDAAWMIASGAQGLVSDDPELLHALMTTVFAPNTLTKTPSVIGHRGNPSVAPENSIEGYLAAVANGATEVETDIYFTKDQQIIIMHDNTLNRTTNYTGSQTVGQMTLDEIRQYRLLNKDGSVSDAPVPTLEEMFVALKDTDVRFVIELKSGDEAMLKPLFALIGQYGVAHRVNFISFNGPVLKATWSENPIISAGLLAGSLTANPADPAELAANTFDLIRAAQSCNTTVNISQENLSREFYKLLNDRGMTLWPWTYNNSTSVAFCKGFLWGFDGLTTDTAQYTRDTVQKLTLQLPQSLLVPLGGRLELGVNAVTYSGASDTALGNVEVTWLENAIGAEFDTAAGIFTAGQTQGTASFMLSYRATLPDGQEYRLYTQPITVTVSASAPAQTPADGFPWWILLPAAGAVILGAVLVPMLLKKKK